MEGLDPSKIALIDIVKGKKLKEKYGPEGENGVIFIETVDFARKRYTRMFAEISPEYKKQFEQAGSDSCFQYVLDGSPINTSKEQMLAALLRKDIDSINVMFNGELNGKQTGVGCNNTNIPMVMIRTKTN